MTDKCLKSGLQRGSTGVLNLDTHILIHALVGDLTPVEGRLLRNHRWSISAIVLWEIAKLAQLGRIEVGLDDRSLRRILASVQIWPLTEESIGVV